MRLEGPITSPDTDLYKYAGFHQAVYRKSCGLE